MKRLLAAIFMVLLFTAQVASNTINPPKGFHGTLYNSTLVLYGAIQDDVRPLCTATVFDKTADGYLLLSAGHCVISTPSEVVFSVADDLGGTRTPVKIVKAVRDHATNMDFSVFELKTTKQYTVIPLEQDPVETIEDGIISVNFSEVQAKSVSPGQISSGPMGTVAECAICKDNFMVQLYASAGASGSAVVSEKTHKIIGIIVGGQDANIGAIVEPISRFAAFQTMPDAQSSRTSIND